MVATVGTINMDFRSLYLHFECGAWLYGCEDTIQEIKEDMLHTLDVCREIKLEAVKSRPFIVGLLQSILRLFAPML